MGEEAGEKVGPEVGGIAGGRRADGWVSLWVSRRWVGGREVEGGGDGRKVMERWMEDGERR